MSARLPSRETGRPVWWLAFSLGRRGFAIYADGKRARWNDGKGVWGVSVGRTE